MRVAFSNTIKRIVIKVGSSVLTDESGLISQQKVKALVEQITFLVKKKKKEVVLVSSGAVACGMYRLGLTKRPSDLSMMQAAAATGQGALINTYETYFSKQGFHTGQMLLTLDSMHNRTRYLNARNTIHSLLELKVIPIVNENDTVSTEELRFGDNDNLSAQVTMLADADLLVILSDVDGFMMGKGKARHVLSSVKKIDSNLTDHIEGMKDGGRTVGGMHTKVAVGFTMMRLGVPVVIANGNTKNVVSAILEGDDVGTLFEPQIAKQSSKKRWLAFTATTNTDGAIIVDPGAAEALMRSGNSLLATGIVGKNGTFAFGDPVRIEDVDGIVIGKGITNYSSEDIERIRGKKSAEIKTLLGSETYREVVHCDNLVTLV